MDDVEHWVRTLHAGSSSSSSCTMCVAGTYSTASGDDLLIVCVRLSLNVLCAEASVRILYICFGLHHSLAYKAVMEGKAWMEQGLKQHGDYGRTGG